MYKYSCPVCKKTRELTKVAYNSAIKRKSKCKSCSNATRWENRYVKYEEAIKFYKKIIGNRMVGYYQFLEIIAAFPKSSWPKNIPRSPFEVYKGSKVSDITGTVCNRDIRNERKDLIISYLRKNRHLLESADDLTVLLCLDRISDGTQSFNILLKSITQSIKMHRNIEIVVTEINNDRLGTDDLDFDTIECDTMDVATISNILESSDDIEIDIRKLMEANGLAKMWRDELKKEK